VVHGGEKGDMGTMGCLDGRVACVTGSTRGVGLGIASAFLREGAMVTINGRNVAKAQNAINELDAGERVHLIIGNVKQRNISAESTFSSPMPGVEATIMHR